MNKDKMTTDEKTLRVREDMVKKKFSSIEEACKFYKFAPASYYNHVKKLPSDLLPEKPTTANNWISEIETLRKENETLRLRMFKLERKLVSVSLGEATI